MPPVSSSPEEPRVPEPSRRVPIGAGVLVAVTGMLVLALNGRHTLFPPPGRPPTGGGETVAEETAAATRFLTGGSGPARKFGTHEIVLTGNGSVSNPFDTAATVTFTPPSGPGNAKTVDAFYDGGNTWRARVYVTETGSWTWRSASPTDLGLDNRTGHFTAQASSFRGLLKLHPDNSRAWITDNGQWFANISDTGYLLFHSIDAPLWKQWVKDSAAKGSTSIRVAALGGWGETPGVDDNAGTWIWNDPWAGGATPDYERFDLAKFRNTDARMTWIFNHYPNLYLQMILFSLKDYGTDNTGLHWFSLAPSQRIKTMRYMIARWSAFPNLFWLTENDMNCGTDFPNNQAFVREVGNYFAENEPWVHLMSAGPTRFEGFPFTEDVDRPWCTYIYIEDYNGVGATQIERYGFDSVPLQVFMGEDYYEQDHGHYTDPRYYWRWLYWSWTLAGGSGNYCGRWGVIHPYSETSRSDLEWVGFDHDDYTGEQLVGLDSVRLIAKYFKKRGIDLGHFTPDASLATDVDGRQDHQRPVGTHRGDKEILVYHPNSVGAGQEAVVDESRFAGIHLDLTGYSGTYKVEWMRALDGVTLTGPSVRGGSEVDLTAPWRGYDVVLRLVKQ
jgi:hypothetical protein